MAWKAAPAPGSQNRVAFGIIRAILAHLYLAWIHPFGDGNGRTARSMELHLLMDSGVPSAAAQLLNSLQPDTFALLWSWMLRAAPAGT